MWPYFLYLLTGLFLLLLAADRFVAGASAMARHYRVSPLIVGLTVVAFGTSAPEIFVAMSAVLQNSSGIVIGNALGSNIANIGLVLGLTAIIAPIKVQQQLLRRECPVLFIVMLMTWVLMLDGHLTRLDGLLLLSVLIALMAYVIYLVRLDRFKQTFVSMVVEGSAQNISCLWAWIYLVAGLIALPLSAKLLVYAAVHIAKLWGMSELVIGLTIIAIGTSLPEVATSLLGSIKGEHDIAIGNVLGSNIFNMLAVLSLPALIQPISIDSTVLWRDMSVMFSITLLLFIVAYGWRKPGRITRLSGSVLLGCYAVYLAFLI